MLKTKLRTLLLGLSIISQTALVKHVFELETQFTVFIHILFLMEEA